MNRAGIEKFIEHYEEVSARNYYNYQESGIARYDREYHKAKDMVEIGRMALFIADIRAQNGSMRSYMGMWGAWAVDILHNQKYEDQTEVIQQLLRDMKAVCVSMGLCNDRWKGDELEKGDRKDG